MAGQPQVEFEFLHGGGTCAAQVAPTYTAVVDAACRVSNIDAAELELKYLDAKDGFIQITEDWSLTTATLCLRDGQPLKIFISATGLQQRLYKYHLFFEGHYVAFRNARPVTFNADGAPPVEGTDDLMDAFSRGFRDILPSFGPALRVWPFLPRHGELFKFSQSIRWLESDWLICFLPMVVQRSFLVTNFLTPKARTRIAQLGEDMGVRGSVSRVAHGYEGDSALQIQAISLKPEVLQEFADAFVGLGGEGTQVADRREAVSDFMELYKIPPVSIILGSAFVTCSAEDRPEPSMPGLPTHSPIPGMGTK